MWPVTAAPDDDYGYWLDWQYKCEWRPRDNTWWYWPFVVLSCHSCRTQRYPWDWCPATRGFPSCPGTHTHTPHTETHTRHTHHIYTHHTQTYTKQWTTWESESDKLNYIILNTERKKNPAPSTRTILTGVGITPDQKVAGVVREFSQAL